MQKSGLQPCLVSSTPGQCRTLARQLLLRTDRTTIPFMAHVYCPTDFFTENASPFCYRIYWRQLHLLRYRTGCRARQSLLLHVRGFTGSHRSQPATSKWLSNAHLSTNKTAINSWTTTNQFRSSIHGLSSSSLTALPPDHLWFL